MEGIVSLSAERAKQKLLEQLKRLRDARLRTRYWIARSLKVSRSIVYRTKSRFDERLTI